MIVVVAKYLIPKGFVGLTLFPFVILGSSQSKADAAVLNHERIHLRQQAELLVLPFFVWYAVEYVVRYIRCGNFHKAYHDISFEREAYAHEKSPDYLESRAFWSFLRYM